MSKIVSTHTCELPPHIAGWRSLVDRSKAAWNQIDSYGQPRATNFAEGILDACRSLDEMLAQCPNVMMLWFFQTRRAFMSQKRLQKWSRERLEDYVLLPALPGFVLRRDCFFVSHYWGTRTDPDPDGQYLRLHQANMDGQDWSYIWVDWTCMPQGPRTKPEELYFKRCLRTMSGIIRNCAFTYFYPPFEPRMWILYEINEFALTCDGGLLKTPDVEIYLDHIEEMIAQGVQATLTKHKYRCSDDGDRQYLTSWLELLVLLKCLQLDIGFIRKILDHLTWFHVRNTQSYPGLVIDRYRGTLTYGETIHTFTPFPLEPEIEDGFEWAIIT